MKRGIGIAVSILMVVAMSSPALAKKGGKPAGPPGPGESQAGGLPALEDRVEADEALITTLQAQVATLQGQVSTLQSEVSTLQGQVSALQGQNNWAVLNAAGTVERASSSAGPVTSEKVATGQYEVTFSRNVSGCVYEATIGDAGTSVPVQGQISVSGDADTDSPNDVFVQTFDRTGLIATDSPFHLTVTCP